MESFGDNPDKKAVYEKYKNRLKERVERTCQWFLNQPNFRDYWLDADSGILLLTADPGCRKLVLTKFFVDCELLRHLSEAGTQAAICYFFFKDPVQTNLNQALYALLHQFFDQQPHLL